MALAGPPAGTLFSVCLGVVRGFRGAGCCRLGAWVSELVGWIRVARWADWGGVVPVIRVVISGLVWGRIRVSRVCGGDAPALEWFLMVS
jgi:hypothetical protein